MFASTNAIFTSDSKVIFDAVTSSSTGSASNSINVSWSHTASGAGRMVIVVITPLQNADNYLNHTRTVTYGGIPMKSFAGMHTANLDARPWMEFFYLHNPPTGSQTVSVTISRASTSYVRLHATAISYMNCRGLADINVSHGSEAGSGLSQTITSYSSDHVIQGFLCYAAFMSGSIGSYSGTSRYSLAASGGSNDNAMVVGDTPGIAPSVTITATRPVAGIGYAEIGARLSTRFVAFNEEGVDYTNKRVPEGVTGCYVTLIGGGGGGGTGYGQAFTACGGGGGGGGAAVIERSFISVADLGSTYSLTIGAGGGSATDGGDTVFTSGSVSITAGGGFKGSNGIAGNGNRAAGGAGGTTSVTGVTVTEVDGTAGGQGGDPGGTASPGTRDGDPGVDNSNGGAPGGGGGGARTSGGVSADGGKGGNSLYANGGAKQSTADNDGNTGGNASAGETGGGGSGGAGGNSGSAGVGGTGGRYGAGGGGGGSGNAVAAGGVGAGGYALIEWV